MSDSSQYYKRTMHRLEIVSRNLGHSRKVTVCLPPGYDEASRYPIVLCQDGDDFYRMGHIATHATRMILDEGLRPAILAGISVELARRTAEYAPDGDFFEAYLAFMAEELMPELEARYPAGGSSALRILAGDSLGAAVSLHLALRHGDDYRQVMSLSGAFGSDTLTCIEEAGDLSDLRMYQLIGMDEYEVRTERGTFDFLTVNRTVRERLERKNARISYHEKPGGHTWGFWQREIPEALRFLLGNNASGRERR